MPQPYTGVPDQGTREQKAKLYQFRELVGAAAPVSLSPTNPDQWRVWKRRDQNGQSSCVYHARAKMAGILRELKTGEFVEYSAADYVKRSNRPADGAYPVEAFDKLVRDGIGIEALEPSNLITAAALDAHVQTEFQRRVAEVSLLDAYYALVAGDFDLMLSTLLVTGKPVPFGIWATFDEWNRNVPTILNPGLTLAIAPVRHEVCATPNFGVWNGEPGFTIEDSFGSTGVNGAGVRWITRSFFTQRNHLAGLVPTSFKDFIDTGVEPVKPKVNLTRDLSMGMVGPDVTALQRVYKYEGLFPSNHPGSDYFGEITKRCTEQYQAAHGIVNFGTPETTGYGRVGRTTRAHINSAYK